MAIYTSLGRIENYNDYCDHSPEDKLQIFLETITDITHAPDYWFDFTSIENRVDGYGPDICALSWLHGKTDEEMKEFFLSHPSALKTIPVLLGIREDKMNDGVLPVFNPGGDYYLNFNIIELADIDNYIKFIMDSGLGNVLKGVGGKGIHASVHDYTYGVEAGLNSNARKNRSGNEGESHLSQILQDIVHRNPGIDLECHGQTTYPKIIDWYGLRTFPSALRNRRFDGSLFCHNYHKGLFAEVNNFNSAGSKSKAVATEFKNVFDIFSETNHEFVYITDGLGWTHDSTHLAEIIEKVPPVLNYKMVEDGWLDSIANKILSP